MQPDGLWANGWKLHKDSTDHAITVWRLDQGSHLVKRSGLRWDIDVRLSGHQQPPQPAPTADPGYDSAAEFPF